MTGCANMSPLSGADNEFSISVALPSSSARKPQPAQNVSRPTTTHLRPIQRPRLAIINLNSLINVSGGAHKSRYNADKDSVDLKLNLNQRRANRVNDSSGSDIGKIDSASKPATVAEDADRARRGRGSIPTSPAAWEFPGRKSPYIRHYKHAWDLQLAKSLLKDPATPRTAIKGRTSPDTYRPIRRAQSAPAVSEKMTDRGGFAECQAISTITITGESLLNTQGQAMSKRSTSAYAHNPRKLGALGAMQGYNSHYSAYPKSYTKMMEIVKTLREEKRPTTSPPVRGGNSHAVSSTVLDLKVSGSAPRKRDPPIQAWGPVAATAEQAKAGTAKPVRVPATSTNSEEDGSLSKGTPSLTVHMANGLRDVQDVTETKLILNRDELEEGEYCHASDYEKGASQLLQYYIARESVEQCAETPGETPVQGRHSDCLRSPRARVRQSKESPEESPRITKNHPRITTSSSSPQLLRRASSRSASVDRTLVTSPAKSRKRKSLLYGATPSACISGELFV